MPIIAAQSTIGGFTNVTMLPCPINVEARGFGDADPVLPIAITVDLSAYVPANAVRAFLRFALFFSNTGAAPIKSEAFLTSKTRPTAPCQENLVVLAHHTESAAGAEISWAAHTSGFTYLDNARKFDFTCEGTLLAIGAFYIDVLGYSI